jgi:acetyl-CoA acetyltransferase
MTGRVFVIGVGMTKFEKPGSRQGWDYHHMGSEAGTRALEDAKVPYDAVEEAYLGYCWGDTTSGQKALYEIGLTGIPAVNVNNACATGSSALYLARKAVASGEVDCTLAIGFEKMTKGSIGANFTDRAGTAERHYVQIETKHGYDPEVPPAPQLFVHAGREYLARYGYSPEIFGRVGEKNHRHSVNNPYAQFRDQYSLEDIMSSRMVMDPLTKLQCSPTSDGGASVVLASERFVLERGLQAQAVEILGQALTTDGEDTFDGSDINLVGFGMAQRAADQVYAQAGLGPEDVDVIELHDCFSSNEVITYESLRLCAEGKGGDLISSGATTYGGEVVVNPSGGLISKGHPLGATGLAQCSELTWQLRGTAGERQVADAKVALQHNLGIGGACVVTMYRKGFDA